MNNKNNPKGSVKIKSEGIYVLIKKTRLKEYSYKYNRIYIYVILKYSV
jgi:hypothetical protein